MASSVSSERAFSSAGITITKCCNRLTHDIVEALQILKAAIRADLLFRPEAPSKALELTLVADFEENMDSDANDDTPDPEEDDVILGTESDGIHALSLDDDVAS